MDWLTVEVFDDVAGAAWAWRDRHSDVLITAAVTAGACYWEWHEHRYGVAFEALFRDDSAAEVFRTNPAVRAALERAPDPLNGVLVYRGRGGGAGERVPRRPRPRIGAGALALPEPEPAAAEPPAEPAVLLLAL